MDVDGVLTDGRLYHFVDTNGRLVEIKGVDTQDGMALIWLEQHGVRTGVISGRSSEGLEARVRMLRMSYVIQGTLDKLPALERILGEAGLNAEQAAYVGDDLPDLPILRRVGWAVAVANSRPEVRRAAHTVTRSRGGQGAIRETAEHIFKAQGLWKGITARY